MRRRFKRECSLCGEMFRPDGKTQKVCNRCLEKRRKEGAEKRKMNFLKNKKTALKDFKKEDMSPQ